MSLTIVMYHYVRPLARTRFPNIKGLDVEQFRGQVEYLSRHYQPIGMAQLIDAQNGGPPLPNRACLLSFDDGYADHYQYVLPILLQAKMTGAFYPPCATLRDRKVLDVNKIHFILAGTTDTAALEDELDHAILETGRFGAEEIARRKQEYRQPNQFDTAGVIYIKRMLQHVLPQDLRATLTDGLFRKYVAADEATFAEELYMTEDQVRVMIESGMHFGGHGDRHGWLSRLSDEQQREEVDRSTALLLELGIPATQLTFCYPYGDHDHRAKRALRETGYRVALTTRTGIARPETDDPLELPRLDTNDLPFVGDAPSNAWTASA